MGRFLRDVYVKNVTLDEDALEVISEFFVERSNGINSQLPNNGKDDKRQVFLTYVIRFDNKGYRLFHIDDVLKYYKQAKIVERIIFTIESGDSISTSRLLGTHMELRLDAKDNNNCFFGVSGEDSDWVDSAFNGVMDIITKNTNKNAFIRNNWTQFLVQIVGVVAGFIISLWAGIKIAPHLAFENAFVVSFLFAFLVFSNVWTYLNQRILSIINYCFPNLRFYRKGKDKIHWILQALIGGLIVALSLFLLNKLFSYIGKLLGEFIKSQ
ncbi:MAG: hypothetical protein ABIN18_20775 [Pseudomonadota bacterium]